MTKNEFLSRIKEPAIEDMLNSGILASLTVAQAILESGWGQSGLTVKGNALFGIKANASWTGRVYVGSTQECYDGVNMVQTSAAFRAYDSWKDSIKDHSALLTGLSRYAAVVGEKDYKSACRTVHAAGYATDPNYSDKLISLIETFQLYKYDTEALENMKKIEELEKRIAALEDAQPKRYNKIEELPEFYQSYVKDFVDRGIIKGNVNGQLDITIDSIRDLIFQDRKDTQA